MRARWQKIRSTVIWLVVLGAMAAPPPMFIACARCRPRLNTPRRPPARRFLRHRSLPRQLEARRSVQIYAPIVPQLRIAWLAASGRARERRRSHCQVRSQRPQQQLQEKEAALKQAQATLDQALAHARASTRAGQAISADAKFNVEKAKLEASKAEIVSKLQGEESRIDLGWPKQKLQRPGSHRRICTIPPTKPRSPRSPASAIRRRPKSTSPITACRNGAQDAPQRRRHVHAELLARLDERQAVSRWATRCGPAARWPRFRI